MHLLPSIHIRTPLPLFFNLFGAYLLLFSFLNEDFNQDFNEAFNEAFNGDIMRLLMRLLMPV